MNNETAPILDNLEELKQECKAIKKAQALVMVSCWFFGMGANQLQTASDYDLRYLYLRMRGKATTVDFTHLYSIFIIHRNPKAILQLE